MGHYVRGDNIGGAWLAAFTEMDRTRGNLVNLVVDIADPTVEDLGVRGAIDRAVAGHLARKSKPIGNPQSVHTVANTIFPISLYRPGTPGAAERFMASALQIEKGRCHARKKGWGTYLGRLVDYPAPDGSTNQLALMVDRLREERHWADLYEMPIAAPGDERMPCWEGGLEPGATANAVLHGDVRTDSRRRGGPCLAHVSVTLDRGTLSMVALYRRHSYIARAYGNFLGLARLLCFLATESGHQVGSLMVVTGHAAADATGRAELLRAATASAGNVAPIEVGSRPLGAAWADLELPAVSAP